MPILARTAAPAGKSGEWNLDCEAKALSDVMSRGNVGHVGDDLKEGLSRVPSKRRMLSWSRPLIRDEERNGQTRQGNA